MTIEIHGQPKDGGFFVLEKWKAGTSIKMKISRN